MRCQQIINSCIALKLAGFALGLERAIELPNFNDLEVEDVLQLMIDCEQQHRAQRQYERLMKQAKIPHFPGASEPCPEEVKYGVGRNLNKPVLTKMFGYQWVANHEHLTISGSTGVGKSWIAAAIGVGAIRQGIPCLWKSYSGLLEELKIARADGSMPRLRRRFSKMKIIIIDDWCFHRISGRDELELFEFIKLVDTTGSLVLNSQLPKESWYENFSDETTADAILDRIVHRSHVIEIKGESMRKKLGLNAGGES